MSADAQPNPKQRANQAEERSEKTLPIPTLCVVCGDRACSHLYYGVAACHGCKCFFWRTVKSQLKYTCRYDGNCSISTAGRNACRYCRYNRCLDAGMKMEAVRMEKKNEKIYGKRKKTEVDSDTENFNESQENNVMKDVKPDVKRQRMDNRLLAGSLLLIDRTARDANEGRVTVANSSSLSDAIKMPYLMDADRTEIKYALADGGMACDVECGYGERRLILYAFDWTRQVADIEEQISYVDKMSLLKANCASLCILELASQALNAPDNYLLLPNGTFLHSGMPLPSNCFLNSKLLSSLLKWAHKQLSVLHLSEKELAILKALIILNPESCEGLSSDTEEKMCEVRSRLQSALFQFCCETSGNEYGARRMANILLLLPQIQTFGLSMVDHIRMRNTFNISNVNSFGKELWGDIFEHTNEEISSSYSDSSCSPLSSASYGDF